MREGTRKTLLACLACLAPLVFCSHARAAGDAILPLAEVRSGMVGEARTVFQGTRPEPFKVRVVSILRNFLPKQDIILVRAEDPRVDITGIAAGMSGSPVYVDGKLMGAIAYGWSFAKEPLAGVTPIEAMLAERDRPDRPPPEIPTAQKGTTAVLDSSDSASRPQPVAIPLSVSGASDASLAYLGEELREFGVRPTRAGGAGDAGKKPDELLAALVPGAAVGVALIQGDMATTAMGTLTYSDGKQILAFGHPMFGIGAVDLPMVLGEIHAIIPSLSSSIKMSSPVAGIGSITDDGKNGIVGRLGTIASTVPVTVHVHSQGVEKPTFQVQIARHRRLLPMLTTMAVSTALGDAIPDVTDLLADVTTRIEARGFPAIELRDQLFSSEGLAPRVLAMAHGMRALGDLVGNPFAPVTIDKIEVRAQVSFRPASAEVVAVAAPGDKVHAGERIPLRVTLRPYSGAEYVETLQVDVPASLAGRAVKIEVAAGALVHPELARAEDLRGFIDNLRVFYPASSLVVSLSTPDDGASLHGSVIRNLPPSALDTLKPASLSKQADGFHVVKRSEFREDHVFTGQKEITLLVRDRRK